MFEAIAPEQCGLSSADIANFIKKIESRGAIMHSLLIMRHGKILTEHYWAPFTADFCHRMYSQTKSYTAIAIGLLIGENKLSLDTKLVDIYPEYRGTNPFLDEQTVENMLTMNTVGNPVNWFSESSTVDRVEIYFRERHRTHPAGTIWEYDSAGSQVLSQIVEKLAGMPLLDYLRRKLFDKMGTFQTAEILKTRNGASWGDSALLCTTRDMASFGQLLMNGGVWNDERLIDEEFVRAATSKQVDNRESWEKGAYSHGYGYQIWRTEQNGFGFLGMGDEITICLPERDLVFVCTADHQGTENRLRKMLVSSFFDLIVDKLSDTPLPNDPRATETLKELTKDLRLYCETGLPDSDWRQKINEKRYVCEKNPMGITEFTFRFEPDGTNGVFCYTNDQGYKEIPFGVNHNVFGTFPQLGYSSDFGGLTTNDGFCYRDAVSLAWLAPNKLILFVQIIDRYFGLMSAVFAFRDSYAAAQFRKVGEDFLNEYKGDLYAQAEN